MVASVPGIIVSKTVSKTGRQQRWQMQASVQASRTRGEDVSWSLVHFLYISSHWPDRRYFITLHTHPLSDQFASWQGGCHCHNWPRQPGLASWGWTRCLRGGRKHGYWLAGWHWPHDTEAVGSPGSVTTIAIQNTWDAWRPPPFICRFGQHACFLPLRSQVWVRRCGALEEHCRI